MISSVIQPLKSFIKKYHLEAFVDVALFMGILLFFHFLYRALISDIYAVQILDNSREWLAYKVFLASEWFLHTFNVKVTTFEEFTIDGRVWKNLIYYPEGNGYVAVNRACSGMKQFYQWIILMLLYPGPWKHKLWFIPMGLGIVHLVNIGRIVGMTFVTINLPQHWDFIHDWIMRPFFYVVMFMLWAWWNDKFRHAKKAKVSGQ
ncbi:MAG: hypothetical protein DRJ05_16200 [Bacteroidetes bacterium]|nr:MAG: hypothetical protein DRJ05_16200 [Bacteroidota bacterium]